MGDLADKAVTGGLGEGLDLDVAHRHRLARQERRGYRRRAAMRLTTALSMDRGASGPSRFRDIWVCPAEPGPRYLPAGSPCAIVSWWAAQDAKKAADDAAKAADAAAKAASKTTDEAAKAAEKALKDNGKNNNNNNNNGGGNKGG